ncbi:hypothetical protein C0J52_26968, partial [Blattella germanica]
FTSLDHLRPITPHQLGPTHEHQWGSKIENGIINPETCLLLYTRFFQRRTILVCLQIKMYFKRKIF